MRGSALLLRVALVFLVIALICGVLGFGGLPHVSNDAARLGFPIFIALFVATLIVGGLRGRSEAD